MSADSDRRRWWQGWPWCYYSFTARDRTNELRFGLWGAAAVTLYGIAHAITKGPIESRSTAEVVLCLLPLLPGAVAVRAYRKFLQEAEELIRQIHRKAATTAFGTTVATLFGCELLTAAFGWPGDPVPLALSVIILTWTVSLAAQLRRIDA